MADPIFEGTTFSFNGTGLTPLVSLEYSDDRDEVPNCGAGDTTETVLVGCGKETVVAEVVGSPAVATGAKGATVAAWSDSGTAGTFTHAICTDVQNGGGYNGQITKRLTFRPSNA